MGQSDRSEQVQVLDSKRLRYCHPGRDNLDHHTLCSNLAPRVSQGEVRGEAPLAELRQVNGARARDGKHGDGDALDGWPALHRLSHLSILSSVSSLEKTILNIARM